jgi:hypothetical protein
VIDYDPFKLKYLYDKKRKGERYSDKYGSRSFAEPVTVPQETYNNPRTVPQETYTVQQTPPTLVEVREEEEKAAARIDEREDGYLTVRGANSETAEESGSKSGLLTIAFILLSFALTLVFSEILGGSGVMRAMQASLRNEESAATAEAYYFLAEGAYETRLDAEAVVPMNKAQGGAGYVYKGADGYYVVATVSYKKDDAEAIAEKNASLKMLTLTRSDITIANATDAQITATKRLNKDAYMLINSLIDIANTAAAGDANSALLAVEKANTVRNNALKLKQEIADSTELSKGQKYRFYLRIDPIIGGVEDLKKDNADVVKKIRCIACTAAYSCVF